MVMMPVLNFFSRLQEALRLVSSLKEQEGHLNGCLDCF